MSFYGVLAAQAENIAFPADAGVFDVRRDGGAKGDGVTDDTAALRAAVSQNGRLVYLPNGTYLISDTLPFAAGARRSHRIILQGQSTTGTVIRLRDQTPLFVDPTAPRALVNTGRAPAQCFRHSLRNLTFDTGSGNPGAIGVQYFANNQGTMSRVAIRSGDGTGPIGLDLGYTDEQGPCLIEQVSVEGFDVGIALTHGVNSVTMEHIRLSGQRLVGIRNDGQPVWIRGLASTNTCPALDSSNGGGLVTLVEAQLQGVGRAEHLAAIVTASQLYLRSVATSGYARPVQAVAPFKVALPTEAYIGEWVSHPAFRLAAGSDEALHLPVKETPDVPWDEPSTWQSVAQSAPETREYKDTKGRTQTVEDWTAAFQKAIDSGATTVYFPRGREYGLFGEVRVRGNVRRIIAMEAGFRTPAGAPRGRIVVDAGASEVVVLERFDPLYASIELIHAAPRTLVYRNSCGMNLQTRPGAGDLFLVDVAPEHPWPDRGNIPTILLIDHTDVWARQFNPEGNQGLKILNQGGTFWALGVKTEGDSTCLQTTAGGRSEVLGAFIYANSGRPKQPLFITEDAEMSVTYCENVIRNAPFTNVLVEVRAGVANTLTMGAMLPRGGGSMAPLLVSRQATRPPGSERTETLRLPTAQPPVIAFDVQMQTLREGLSTTVVVRRVGVVAASCVVPLEVRGAAHRVHVEPLAVLFAPGQAQADVRVSGLQDTTVSPPSTVLLDLALGSWNVREGNAVTMALEDDDTPPAGQGTGLHAVYFAGTNWVQVATSRVERTVDFAWDKKPPVAGLRPETGYAVRWTGFVAPQYSEPYTFTLQVGKYSQARLWIDERLVVDAWSGTPVPESPIALQAGKRYSLRLEYAHRYAYGSLIKLRWSSPSQFVSLVPASQLHPDAQVLSNP